MSKLLKLFLVISFSVLSANGRAVAESLHSFNKRAGFYGGYGLTISPLDTCPTGLNACGPVNCCPPDTVCNGSGICCPDTNDCTETVVQNPSCADPSLIMYLNHIGTSTLLRVDCCHAGQVIDVESYCAMPGGSGPVSAQDPSWTTAPQGNTVFPSGAAATPVPSTTGTGSTPTAQASGSGTTTTATSKSGGTKHAEVGLLGTWIIAVFSLFL